MKIIDFNLPMVGPDGKKTFLTPDGREHEWGMLGQRFALILAEQTEGKTLKLYGWMKSLQVGDPLHLDDADEKDLEKLIEENRKMFVFFKGQLLELIANASDKSAATNSAKRK